MKTIFFAILLCCLFCYQSWLQAAEWEEEFEVIEVDLGPTTGYPKHLVPNKQKDLPLVIIYANGYDTSAPDSTTFECWTYFDSYYAAGSLIYFGTKIGNYESTPTKITLEWQIIGPTKTTKIRQTKNLPAAKFSAYFLRRSLPPVEGATYAIQTKAFFAQPGVSPPGALLHEMVSFFYISDVY